MSFFSPSLVSLRIGRVPKMSAGLPCRQLSRQPSVSPQSSLTRAESATAYIMLIFEIKICQNIETKIAKSNKILSKSMVTAHAATPTPARTSTSTSDHCTPNSFINVTPAMNLNKICFCCFFLVFRKYFEAYSKLTMNIVLILNIICAPLTGNTNISV